MIDPTSLPKNAPPAYMAPNYMEMTSPPMASRQEPNLNVQAPVQKAPPAVLANSYYPAISEDAAAIGTRYQAELFARCARGEHQPTRKFGPCGIITAVFLFPIGLICLFQNSERQCSRCGIRLP